MLLISICIEMSQLVRPQTLHFSQSVSIQRIIYSVYAVFMRDLARAIRHVLIVFGWQTGRNLMHYWTAKPNSASCRKVLQMVGM